MRTCSKCGARKPTEEFYVVRRDQATGEPVTLRRQCKKCMKRKAKAWAENRPRSPVDLEDGVMLPVGPFREWLLARLADVGGQRRDLAHVLKTSERRIYSWLHVSEHIHIDAADRALMEAGWMLRDVYPELYVFDLEEAA